MRTQDKDLNWADVDAALDQVLDQPAEDREAFIQAHFDHQPALARRLRGLLDAHRSAGDDFMEPPAEEPDQPRLRAGERIGPWSVEEFIARGGMGEVYRVQRADGQYDQVAALKLITSTDAQASERFLNERQILARLQHPNIAQLLDGGLTETGRPYMAMEYLDGQTITDWSRGRGLRDRIDIFLQAAKAVEFAHQHAIIHRDIKPNNVIVTRDDRVKLLDFGIAKSQQVDNANMTVGLATPNYAAPEQLHGGMISTAIDVYALGALLYAILAGRPPLDMANLHIAEVLQRLRDDTPEPPSAHSDLPLPADLDAICLHALRKEPQERYTSVTAMIADVEALRAHRPVKARGKDWGYRARCYLRRNAVVLSTTGVVIASLVAALFSVSWHAARVADERDIASRESAKLATLRTSVLQIFRSAVGDAGDAPLTARELFARSASKIETEFGDDPATAATLLQMLGELHLYTEDYSGAADLLQRVLTMDPSAIGAEVLADSRYDMAQIAFKQGHVEQARQLFQQATDYWKAHAGRHGPQLIWSATLASQLARHDGDTGLALRLLEQAALRADEVWGRNHPETGVVLINLAVAHYYANDVRGGIAACERAWKVWQALDRTESPDALNLLSNWGLFLIRAGELIAGEKRLEDALELRSRLYGASAAQGVLMRHLGVVHVANGRVDDGIALLEQSVWMAEKYAGPGSAIHTSALCELGRVQAENGRIADAETTVRTAVDLLGDNQSRWDGYCRGVLGDILTRRGSLNAAEVQIGRAVDILTERGTAAETYLADAQLFLARLRARQKHWNEADTAYLNAVELKTRARSADYYQTLAIQVERGATLIQRGDGDTGAAMAAAALERLKAQLGPDHPFTLHAASQLTAGTRRL